MHFVCIIGLKVRGYNFEVTRGSNFETVKVVDNALSEGEYDSDYP